MQESKRLYVRIITALLLLTLVLNMVLIFRNYGINDSGGASGAFLIHEEGRFGMAGFATVSALFGVLLFTGFGGGLKIENNSSDYKFENLYKRTVHTVKNSTCYGPDYKNGLSVFYDRSLFLLKVRTGLEAMLTSIYEMDGMK